MAINQSQKRYLSILKVSADRPEELGATNVDRVMSEAKSQRRLKGFRKWLLSQNLDDRTRQVVTEWHPE